MRQSTGIFCVPTNGIRDLWIVAESSAQSLQRPGDNQPLRPGIHLPTNGETVNVRLFSLTAGFLLHNDFNFTAYTAPPGK